VPVEHYELVNKLTLNNSIRLELTFVAVQQELVLDSRFVRQEDHPRKNPGLESVISSGTLPRDRSRPRCLAKSHRWSSFAAVQFYFGLSGVLEFLCVNGRGVT
jgi:hypothetical protein